MAVQVKLEDAPLKQVKEKKVLGVTVDQNLTFKSHVENVRVRALKTLSSISRLLDETGGMRTALGLQLYNSLVYPVLTYAYPVWSTVSNTQLSALEDVHEAALRKLTGTHGGTATNALEVILGILPFCVTVKDAQRTLQSELLKIWQRQWDTQLEGRFTHSLFPTVKLRSLHKHHGRVLRGGEIRLNRLQSGNSLLRTHHLSQSLERRAGNPVTTQCDCHQGPQDCEHLFLGCPIFASERESMTNNIMEAILKNKHCSSANRLSLRLLIGDDASIPSDVKVVFRKEVLNYLAATIDEINI